MDKIRDLRIKEKFFMDDEYLSGYASLCGIYATGVYMSLCRHSNKEQTCFPSKKLISKELKISERSVFDAIKILEFWNIIKTKKQARKIDGSYKNNIYILLDKSKWKQKPQASHADGPSAYRPQVNYSNNRERVMPNKETNIKETNDKGENILKIKEECRRIVKK